MGKEQYGISDSASATVATATLKVFGIVTKSKSKLKRKQSKCKEESRLQQDCLFSLVNSIHVDGRKNAIIKSNERRGNYY